MTAAEDNELYERLEVEADTSGERLDVFCVRVGGNTRSFMQKRIAQGDVLVNGSVGKANTKLRQGDCVEIMLPPPAVTELAAEDIPLSIVYQDADIAVIDKPKGMVVHPAPGNPSGTLVNALMYHVRDLSGIGGELRPGIVHRIDKLTSGLIVIAKNDFAHNSLAAQIKEHSAYRTYVALVDGNLKEDCGTIDAPIGRHRTDRKRMAVVDDGSGREAVTHWSALHRFGDYTLLKVKLETGRTHQIRVHMAYIKHPVTGDDVYGARTCRFKTDGQMLHAVRLELTHPRTGERMAFFAPLPEYFTSVLRALGLSRVPDLFNEQ